MNKRVLCIVLTAILLLGNSLSAFATTVNQVQQEKNATQKKLNEINQSITAIEKKKKEVRSQLSNLNEDLVDLMLELEVLEADIESKQEEIDVVQAEYDAYRELEAQQYEAMKLRIQYMYEKDSMELVSVLVGAKSLSDLINRADFAREVSDYDDEKLAEYEETKRKVEDAKLKLEAEQEVLLEIQHDQLIYKEELNEKISSAKKKASNFEKELATAQAKATEYKNTIKEQNAKIAKLEEEARRAAEEAARKAEEEAAKNGSSGSSSSGSGSSSSGSSSSSDASLGQRIANYALQFVGNPYVYGGTSLTNGADCSGFTQAVFRHFGISIPRRSQDQANGGKSVPLSLSSMLPGDIIYYSNHVALYIGNGKVVHASTEKTGIKTDVYNYRTPTRVRRYW